MYGVKLCLGLSECFGLPWDKQIQVLRKIGFEGFFCNWQPNIKIEDMRRTADAEGMIFQSVHAPFGRIDTLWEPVEDTPSVIAEQIACLRDCSDNNVPIMVAHTFIGFTKHTPTAQGVDNFGVIVREAEKLGVRIAFENTEGEEYLAALMNAFKGNTAVGFCWDTGHEMCYNRSQDMLALYGDRLLCTHLNDNLGIRDFEGQITYIDDLHLLPFDGVGDWQNIADRLNRHHFNDLLTFELTRKSKPGRCENDVYAHMEPLEYLTQAYMRACRVATLKQRAFAKHVC